MRHQTKSGIRGDQRGTILAIMIVTLLALLGTAALFIDLGYAFCVAAKIQNVADAAALAGADSLRDNVDQTAAAAEATKVAAANSIGGVSVSVSPKDVVVGGWDPASKRLVPWSETLTQYAVQVTVRCTKGSTNGPVPTFFARVFGVTSLDMSRTATAGLTVSAMPRNAVKVMLVQDSSCSFQPNWQMTMNANKSLMNLINANCLAGDSAGFVGFCGPYNFPGNGVSPPYDMPSGLKETTDSNGVPRKVDQYGNPSSSGKIRMDNCGLIDFSTSNRSSLPTALNTCYTQVMNDNAYGNTDTAAGLNNAVSQLRNVYDSNASKVIVLVSDGMPYVYGASSKLNQNAIDAANTAAAMGVKVFTVTLSGSQGADYAFEESLVRNGGCALRADDATKLQGLLLNIGNIVIGHAKLIQ